MSLFINPDGKQFEQSLEDFMRNTFFLLLVMIAAMTLASCDAGDTGNFKIRLRLPIDDGVCSYPGDEEEDYSYCIHDRDQVLLTIYSSTEPSGEYIYADRKLIRVEGNNGGKEEFIRSLKKGTYYRFFVEVTNANEKLKLTGGLDSVLYDDDKNFEVDIFMGAVGDFVRVVKNRENYYDSSLMSYFESSGSKGAGAAALKGGKLYLSGGYSFDWDQVMSNTTIFDLKTMEAKKGASLRPGLMDHAVAFLDDGRDGTLEKKNGSELGKVVVAFGTTDVEGYSNEIKIYDPESDRYKTIGYGDSVTRARALTIDGNVYIAGGCNKDSSSRKIYKIDKISQTVGEFKQMNTGRCNFAMADISTVNEDGSITPRILIVGGSTNEDGTEFVSADNFVEVVTAQGATTVALTDRNGEDSADLLQKGLVSPAAASLLMDDIEASETVVALVGGYLQDGEEDNKTLLASKNMYVLSEQGDKWVYDVNASPFECTRPSIGKIGAEEKSTSKYAAVNCGTGQIARTSQAADSQTIFVVQVKRAVDKESGNYVFGSSVKDSLIAENKDADNGVLVDGPIAVNELGQGFVFGTEFVYQVSGYAIP